MIITPGHILLKSTGAAFFGVVIRKTFEIPERDIPKVAHQVHYFVVAQQAHDLAACLLRLLIEGHHQVQYFARLWSAIDQISKLNQGGFAARPVAMLVNEVNSLQNGGEVVEVSMNIPDCNEYGIRGR